MPSLLYGARDFLKQVFAHRLRQRDQFIESFRLRTSIDLSGRTPEQRQEGARTLFQQGNKTQ